MRLPGAFLGAVCVVLLIECCVRVAAVDFMESQPLVYETKMAALDRELQGEVVVFGDSTAVAEIVPAAIQDAFPEQLRVMNLALPGSGPVVAEYLMDELLARRPDQPPRLVVLAFSTLSFTEWRPNFVEYPLTHLLPFTAVVRAAWADRDAGYVLEWMATRVPSLRYREEIKSGALSLLFDRSPALMHRYQSLVASDEHDSQFRWRHLQRAARNRRLASDLVENRGWRLFEEMRLPAGELDRDVRFDQGTFYFPPFEATPREELALRRLLDVCERRRIPVLVLPSAQPEALDAALALAGGEERLEAFEGRVFGGRPEVAVPLGLRMAWPHRYFADLAHVNESGVDRYTQTILPTLREVAAGL